MSAAYDIFLSHAWKDGERPQHIADALTAAGLRVWFDATEIDDFASITRAVTEGLAKSKALLAYYSTTYPLRRACQWELTAAFLAAQTEGDPRRRVLVINPESGADHIHPIELRDAKFRNAPNTDGEMQQLVQAIVKHVAELSAPLADIHPLGAPNWYGMTPVGSTRFVGRLKEMWEVHSLLRARDAAQITGAPAATGGIGQVQGWAEWANRCWRKSTRCTSARPIPAASSGCAPTATMTPRPRSAQRSARRSAPTRCAGWLSTLA